MAAEGAASNGTGVATGLRANYLPFPEVMAQSVANIAPTAAAGVTPALIYAKAANGTWLSLAISAVAMVLVGFTIVYFARRFAATGSFYQYAATSLGSLGGFMSGWGLLFAYLVLGGVVAVGFGIYTIAFLGISDTRVVQVLLYAVAVVAAFVLAYRDIKLSARLALGLEVASVGLLLVLAVIVLAKHGLGDSAQWKLSGSSFTGIRQGLVLAVLMFVGFENAAVLGAEAKNPYRTIPLAIVSSVAIVGVFYVFMSYTEVLGFASAGRALGDSQAPLNDLAEIAGVGSLGRIIDLGIAVSMFGCLLASINAGARVLFTMGLDGFMHRSVGRAHDTNRTPHVALLCSALVGLVVPAVMVATGVSVLDVVGYLGTLSTFGFLLAYLLVSVAAAVYLYQRGLLRPLDAVVCALAAALTVFVFAGQLYPTPPSPYDRLPYLFAAFLIIGLAWYVAVRLRAPDVLERMGRTMETGGLEGQRAQL